MIECLNGPLDGRRVSARMGDRWPAILQWLPEEGVCVLGDYELNELDGRPLYEYVGNVRSVDGIDFMGRLA